MHYCKICGGNLRADNESSFCVKPKCAAARARERRREHTDYVRALEARVKNLEDWLNATQE